MRRFQWWAFAAVLGVVAFAAPASNAAPDRPLLRPLLRPLFPAESLTVSIVHESPASDGPVAAAVGVYPASRSAEAFLTQVGTGAPRDDTAGGGDPGGNAGRPFALAAALSPTVTLNVEGRLARLFAYGGPIVLPPNAGTTPPRPTLRVVEGPDPDANLTVVLGASSTTPVILRIPWSGHAVLTGGQSRRPGIATPYDIAATILTHFDIQIPAGFVGRPLRTEPGAPTTVDDLARRLRRDAGFMQSLTAWTIVFGLGFGWLVAGALVRLGRREWAARLTTGSSMVTVGFLIGLFVPSARGDVRAIPLLVLFAVGVAVPWRDREMLAMGVFMVASGATAAMAVIAAADPGGPVAAALWGNPLVSWRLYGLQNFAAAFVAGGAVVAATRLGVRAVPLCLLSAAMLVVVGSPRIGANFVAVLTFAFGAAVAVGALRGGALRPSIIVAAAGIAVVAFALVLVSDAGNAASHGGAAAREIGNGGIRALWDLSIHRLRLNVRAINAFPGGWVCVVLFLGLYASMIRDGFKRADWPFARRAAIVAGAFSGLAALLLEDSGFKTTAVLGFPALMLWMFGRAEAPAGPSPYSR